MKSHLGAIKNTASQTLPSLQVWYFYPENNIFAPREPTISVAVYHIVCQLCTLELFFIFCTTFVLNNKFQYNLWDNVHKTIPDKVVSALFSSYLSEQGYRPRMHFYYIIYHRKIII